MDVVLAPFASGRAPLHDTVGNALVQQNHLLFCECLTGIVEAAAPHRRTTFNTARVVPGFFEVDSELI